MITHLAAANDANGNPRRLFIYWVDNTPIACWDESYHGSNAVPGPLREQAYRAQQHTIHTTVAEYNRLKNLLPSPLYYNESAMQSWTSMQRMVSMGLVPCC